jgi:hypothetical protein
MVILQLKNTKTIIINKNTEILMELEQNQIIHNNQLIHYQKIKVYLMNFLKKSNLKMFLYNLAQES